MNEETEKLLNEDVNRLNISIRAINALANNQITKLKQICSKTKSDLKDMGLTTSEIKDTEKELQLLGLNLRMNY